MKNIYTFAVCVCMAVAFATPAQAATTLTTEAKIAQLQALVLQLQTLLAQLQQLESSQEYNSAESENLSISDIRLSLPNGIGHTSMEGYPVPDQKVTVEVKNDANGSEGLSGNKFKYAAYLYELDGIGERSITQAKATGEALVPYANGYTSFDFYIDGGLTFDGTNMEKKYQIRIDIDSEHTVNESNEQDNRGWSDTWVTDYYKG